MAPDRTLGIQGSIPTGDTIEPQEPTRMISVGAPRYPCQELTAIRISLSLIPRGQLAQRSGSIAGSLSVRDVPFSEDNEHGDQSGCSVSRRQRHRLLERHTRRPSLSERREDAGGEPLAGGIPHQS